MKLAIPVVATASLCDTLLILISVSGVSLMIMAVPQIQVFLYTLGFFFLIMIGWSIWHADIESTGHENAATIKKQVMFALSVSLFNPHALLDTVGVIGINSAQYADRAELVAFTIACIMVSWIAFTLLAVLGRVVKTIDQNGKVLRVINKISAISIWGIALFILFELFGML